MLRMLFALSDVMDKLWWEEPLRDFFFSFFCLSCLSCVGWPWTPRGAKDDLELLILLTSTPECQNCRKNATAQFMWCWGSNPGLCGYLASTLFLGVEYYTNESDWGPQNAIEPQTKVLPSVCFIMANSTVLCFLHWNGRFSQAQWTMYFVFLVSRTALATVMIDVFWIYVLIY